MQFHLLIVAFLSGLTLADTVFMPSNKDGASNCMAIKKDQASLDVGMVKRDTALDHCGVSGYLKKRDSEGPSQNHISFDRCADFCVCSLGKETCKSFEWTEDQPKKGLGHCQVHTMNLNKNNHRSLTPMKRDEQVAPVFYNNHCFHEVRRAVAVHTVTGPPPTSTSSTPVVIIPPPTSTSSTSSKGDKAKRTAAPTITSTPVPQEKRDPEPKVDNLVVAALLGV